MPGPWDSQILKPKKTNGYTRAKEFSKIEWAEDVEEAFFRVTTLRDIDIVGDSALVHKKFIGNMTKANGEQTPTEWQTLYRCRKIDGTWKIAGFVGYIPHYLGSYSTRQSKNCYACRMRHNIRLPGPTPQFWKSIAIAW